MIMSQVNDMTVNDMTWHWKSETQAMAISYAESPKTPTEINPVAAPQSASRTCQSIGDTKAQQEAADVGRQKRESK